MDKQSRIFEASDGQFVRNMHVSKSGYVVNKFNRFLYRSPQLIIIITISLRAIYVAWILINQ